MIKKLSMTGVFEKINQLETDSSLAAHNGIAFSKTGVSLGDSLTDPTSRIVEESVSSLDTVADEHCRPGTVASLDTGKNQSLDQNPTVSIANPVKKRRCQSVTLSKLDGEQTEKPNKLTVRSSFTPIPNHILRNMGNFEEPLDFMIYMHLLTYSLGFGKDTVNMGQAQLERFTGAAKNTVKRSLERLKQKKLIRQIENYEHSRVTRKWRITLPEGPDHDSERAKGVLESEKPNSSGLISDSVQDAQCPSLNISGSNLNSVTVFKIDTYKESITKKVLKNSLSSTEKELLGLDELPNKLRDYFTGLAPRAKYESEWKALSGLSREFKLEEIESAFIWLKRNGIPASGKPAYSPLGFLKFGMTQISRQIEKTHQKTIQSIAEANDANFSYDNVASNLMALREKLKSGANCA